jgi:hypothetical protein
VQLSYVRYVNYGPTTYIVSWIPGLDRLIDRVVLPGGIPLTGAVLWVVPAVMWSAVISVVMWLVQYIRSRWRPSSESGLEARRGSPDPRRRRIVVISSVSAAVSVLAVAMFSSVEYEFENPCGFACLSLTRDPVEVSWRSDKDIADFVASRKGLVTKAIHFCDGTEFNFLSEKGYAMLASIEGLEAIVISGCYKTFNPIPLVKLSDDYVFRNVLTDDKFAELLRIPGLKCIWIWYGSLSSGQKRLLHERLPGCCLHENANKF